MNTKTFVFHVRGMHCHACVLMIESELCELPHITSAKPDLRRRSVEVTGVFEEGSDECVAQHLSTVLEKHGYVLSTQKPTHAVRWADFALAFPLAIGAMALLFILQKVGLVRVTDTGTVSYGTAFLIGVVASLSTCMAVVGGLLLSLSATFAKEGRTFMPHALFHLGRLASFFVLGGVIGVLGSAFQIHPTSSAIIGVVVAIVMFVLGINLLDIVHLGRLIPSMPQTVSRRIQSMSLMSGIFGPFLIGVSTFFLPCGFTQSMQVYALSTGTFWTGALTMGIFSLGTLPVLMLISLGSFSVRNSPVSGVFFKTVGLVVIMFALFNFLSALSALGIIRFTIL